MRTTGTGCVCVRGTGRLGAARARHAAMAHAATVAALPRAGLRCIGQLDVVTVFLYAHCVRWGATRSNAVWYVSLVIVRIARGLEYLWPLPVNLHGLHSMFVAQRGLNAMQVALHHQRKGAAYELRQWCVAFPALARAPPSHQRAHRPTPRTMQVRASSIAVSASRGRLWHAGRTSKGLRASRSRGVRGATPRRGGDCSER